MGQWEQAKVQLQIQIHSERQSQGINRPVGAKYKYKYTIKDMYLMSSVCGVDK